MELFHTFIQVNRVSLISFQIRCNNGVHSFGRRRRSANSTLEVDDGVPETETETNVTESEESTTNTHTSTTESDKVENSTVKIANMSQDEQDLGDLCAELTA